MIKVRLNLLRYSKEGLGLPRLFEWMENSLVNEIEDDYSITLLHAGYRCCYDKGW